MARGHTRTRSDVQGISVRSLADEPRIARVGEHFASKPDGSLRELYDAGDKVRLFDKGQYAYLRVKEVKERSIIALPLDSDAPVRLVLEKDSQGRVVGLKESGAKGRRVD
jgi:hypothetical protein